MERYVTHQVLRDLKKKMVFLGGPRQVGKTTLAKSLPNAKKGYLNWDIDEDRERIIKREFPNTPFLIFDEIHKYTRWRNFLKGLYDKWQDQKQILVTGSARLDYYRYGGDSLQGRYHFIRMFPLTMDELKVNQRSDFQTLLQLGGFPEPFLSGSETEAKRWSREYRRRLLKEELTAIEYISDISRLEELALRLPEVVGSPLSINALREDLQLSHKTVQRWVDIFERFYVIFYVRPFGPPRIRAMKKEKKHYHWDWIPIQDPGKRYENCVACHLMKWVCWQEDVYGRDVELRFFKDNSHHEVDFVILENRQPIYLIETKLSDTQVSSSLRYLKLKFPSAKAYQVVADTNRDFVTDENIHVCPAPLFLSQCEWIQ